MANFADLMRIKVNDSHAQILNAFIEADPDSNRSPRKDYRPSEAEVVQAFCDRQFRRGQTPRPKRRRCASRVTARQQYNELRHIVIEVNAKDKMLLGGLWLS